MLSRSASHAAGLTRVHRAAALLTLAMMLMISVAVAPAVRAEQASTLDELQPVVSSAGFTHPGVFNSLENLASTKKRIAAGDSPWAESFKQLTSSPYAKRNAPDFTSFGSASASDPTAKKCGTQDRSGCVSVCGSFNENPGVGCADQQADGRAVYAQALAYFYTGDERYAQRAVAILNAYSARFKGSRGSNGPLMTAWTAGQMVRGAELIRYSYKPTSKKHEFDAKAFGTMLRKVFVPTLTTFDYGRANGNWKLSAAEGLIGIAVFLDDRQLYDRALEMWRERVEAYVYLSTDGELPTAPVSDAGLYRTPTALRCQWLDGKAKDCQTDPPTDPGVRFQNGQVQESCRDFGHAAMGLGGIINTAETAWIQGDDLYAEQQARITTGVLYAVQVSLNHKTRGWPASFCGGTDDLDPSLSLVELPVHAVYNAYTVRKGVQMPAISIPGYPAPKRGSNPVADFIAAKGAARGYAGNVTAWDAVTHDLATPPAASPTTMPAPDQRNADDPSPNADGTPVMTMDVATSAFAIVGVIATIVVLVWIGWRLVRRRRRRADSASR
ncbi:alginate lyase family protein [Microbacterium sp. NPDC089321]|uniref:alginate lyase family protein n=1 Tax=Microbacterium sp. NPDC089321 TaxID=3155183 RepID=UPI00342449C8